MNDQQILRQQLLDLLRGGGAHVRFEQVIADVPVELRGAKPTGIPHSPWRLLEHLRICQWDILRYSCDPTHVSPEHPIG